MNLLLIFIFFLYYLYNKCSRYFHTVKFFFCKFRFIVIVFFCYSIIHLLQLYTTTHYPLLHSHTHIWYECSRRKTSDTNSFAPQCVRWIRWIHVGHGLTGRHNRKRPDTFTGWTLFTWIINHIIEFSEH